jgi:hypothetical protein
MSDGFLSRKERAERLDRQVREGIRRRLEAGHAFKEIRDKKLYEEEGFKTWGKYLRDRFDLTAAEVNRLISDADHWQTMKKPLSSGRPI